MLVDFHPNKYLRQLNHEVKQDLLHLFQQIFSINKGAKVAFLFSKKLACLHVEH